MKFRFYKTSSWHRDDEKTVDLDTLDDLLAWIKASNCEVIVTPARHHSDKRDLPELEIYDDYRE